MAAAWKLPSVGLDSCATADFNADGEDDVALYLVDPATAEFGFGEGTLYLFERTPDGFAAIALTDVFTGPEGSDSGILAAEDVNGEPGDDLVALRTSCGASTCFTDVLLYGFDGASYVSLANPPKDPPPSMAFATVSLEANGPTQDLVLYGGTQGSIGAGPQRAWTETWSWDGEAYSFVLASTVFDASDYLYFAVVDADAAFAEALTKLPDAGPELQKAQDLYERALDGTGLVDWHQESGFGGFDHEFLDPYILFKLARLEGIQQRPGKEDQLLEQAITGYPDAFFAKMAQVYRETQSCDAVTAFLADNEADYSVAWDFGYGNAPPAPADVCGSLE